MKTVATIEATAIAAVTMVTTSITGTVYAGYPAISTVTHNCC